MGGSYLISAHGKPILKTNPICIPSHQVSHNGHSVSHHPHSHSIVSFLYSSLKSMYIIVVYVQFMSTYYKAGDRTEESLSRLVFVRLNCLT